MPLSAFSLYFTIYLYLSIYMCVCVCVCVCVYIIVQLLSQVWLFATPWTVALQAPLFLTISWSLPKFMSMASVMPSSHLIFWCPLLLLPSIFPASGTFLMSCLFTSDDQNTRASASASVLPTNIQVDFKIDRFDLLAVQWTFRSLF